MKLIYKTPFLFCLFIAGYAFGQKNSTSPKKATPKNETKQNVLSPSAYRQRIMADNDFALKLFRNTINANSEGSNLIISPLSVSFALGLAGNGSAGETLDAFKSTLNFGSMPQAGINSYYKKVLNNFSKVDPGTSLSIANSIWYKQGFSIQPQFLKTNADNFNAKIQPLDFSNPAAVNAINDWVKTQTKGKISSIVDKIPADAVTLLVNAIYFKSNWNKKFDASETQKMPFILSNKEQVKTDFMAQRMDINLYRDKRCVIVELPYLNNKFSMVIIMPLQGGLSVTDLNTAQWQYWMANLQLSDKRIIMPKFKFGYTINFKDALKEMGLKAAFSDNANFSRINPDKKLKISEVLQKAIVETDENGSKAAAATSVRIGMDTAPAPAEEIIINHPFLFVIREVGTGLILFTGIVTNPLLQGN